jgi:hypothetical protein
MSISPCSRCAVHDVDGIPWPRSAFQRGRGHDRPGRADSDQPSAPNGNSAFRADLHRLIARIGTVDDYHYDPYAQLLSKIVRGFRKDLEDARDFVRSGWVDAASFRALVEAIPEAAWSGYPTLE